MANFEQQGTQEIPESAIVVGAGFVGAATAYYLAKAGVKVKLVDRGHPGSGASGRSAGYISTITRSAGPQLELGNLSNALYAQLAEELEDFDYRQAGALLYCYEEQGPLIGPFAEKRRSDGLPIEIVDFDRVRELCPILPDEVVGGIYSLSDGYVHAQLLLDSLVKGIEQLNGEVLFGTPVVGLEVESGRCTGVRTVDGRLDADVVALTAGSWSAKLLQDIGFPLHLFHIRLQGAETAPIAERFEVNLYGPTFFHEYEFIREVPGYDDDLVMHPLMRIMPEVGMLEVVVQRADGRLLLGCPIEFVDEFDGPPLPTVAGAAQMFGILGDHIPTIQPVPVERIWAGVASQTGDGLPIMDSVAGMDGLFIGAGHAYGATVGSGSGRVIADKVLGIEPAIDTTAFRYDRPAVQKQMARALMYG